MANDDTNAAPKRKADDVYDRQIRLWGAEAQAKMSHARVLYINVTSVSAEVLKNLVLAGIRAVLCDDRPYDATSPNVFTACPAPQRADRQRQYATNAQALHGPVQDMNPLLGDCAVVALSDLTDDYLRQFAVVIASRITPAEALRWAQAVRGGGSGKFFWLDTFGLNGACLLDWGNQHEFRMEVGKKLLDPAPLQPNVSLQQMWNVPLEQAVNRFYKTPPAVWMQHRCLLEYVQQTNTWPTLETADDFVTKTRAWAEATSSSLLEHETMQPTALLALAKTATAEVSAVASVLGGLVGNEVIKAISGKGTPANNTLLFDGLSCKALTFLIQPKAA